MDVTQPLPTEDSDAGTIARQLARLIGPAYQPKDGTVIAADLLQLGGGIAGGRDTNLASVDEAFPDSAVQLLDELETEYGLQVRQDLSTAARQARLLAKIRAQFAGTLQQIQSSLQAIDSSATVHEITLAQVIASEPNPTAIEHRTGVYGTGQTFLFITEHQAFRFYVTVSLSAFNNADTIAQMTTVIEQAKPAHTIYEIGVNDVSSGSFKYDDASSLMDQDFLTT
jgi:hypothetical protein